MRRLPPALALALLLAAAARGQDDARAVVLKAIKAHGGEARLDRLKVRHHTVRGTIHLQGEHRFTKEVFVQLPGNIKEVMEAEVNGRKTAIVTVLAGDKAFIQIDGKEQPVAPEKLEEMRRAAHLLDATRLTPLKDPAYQVTAAPGAVVKERPALGVKVAARGQKDVFLYFDKESGFLVKTEREALDPQTGKPAVEEYYYSGWRDYDGLKVPTQATVYLGGRKVMDAEAVEMKFPAKLDPDVFAKP